MVGMKQRVENMTRNNNTADPGAENGAGPGQHGRDTLEASVRQLEDLSEEEFLRASMYAMLGKLLSMEPDSEALKGLASLEGDETALGQALAALGSAARGIDATSASDEFHALFIGMNGGELSPYSSFYLTGFLYEKPLAELRARMADFGIERAEGIAEPEDHIASVCEIMAGLITGEFGEPASLGTQQKFFDEHVSPWASKFFEDLEKADASALYMPLGTIGRLFMDIEIEGFRMAA